MWIVLSLLIAAPTPAELLSSREVQQRLEGVKMLHEKGGDAAEALLLKALGDDDWEVVHRAAEALGKHGSAGDSLDALVDVAVKGPTRGIRLAAAASLKQLAAERASELVAKRMRGDYIRAVCDALAVMGSTGGTKQLEHMLKALDPARRRAAAHALAAQKDPERIEVWTKMLRDPDVLVQVEALEALVATGEKNAVGALRDALKGASVSQVMERRYIYGIRRLLLGIKDDKVRNFAAEMCARTFGMAGTGVRDARFARLLGSLGRKEKPVGPVAEYVKTLRNTGLKHRDLEVRRASLAALGRIGDKSVYEQVAAAASSDAEAKVRFHALRTAVRLDPEQALRLALDRTRYDKAVMVREEAATICGNLGKIEAAKTLIHALRDSSWEVRTCAAVSLGKLKAQAAVDPLIALYSERDWRLRGAAVVGMGRIESKKVVPHLITALRDREPAVAASALEYLRHISAKKLSAQPKVWRAWWEKHGPRYVFVDKDKAARDAKKYGYAVTRRAVYEDMDIIVLSTRKGGDNIQVLLKDYGVEHRIIRAASVNKVGLHPYALFVANCPGEITNKDVERLQWFVRAGGYLFASCWALSHTVHASFPDVVDKLPLKGQVIGTVEAKPLPVPSRFLKDVFDQQTNPLYQLEGSHLIRVLDPERFEVLIDSPDAANTWGDGNLAGWFTVGHGTILDSANHFDLQGMKRAKVRTEKERMAFAMDHLGYGYRELRELKARSVFQRGPLAEKETRDQSIFRFITTFVREKRIADEK